MTARAALPVLCLCLTLSALAAPALAAAPAAQNVLPALPAQTEELTPAKRADIQRLMAVSGAVATGRQLSASIGQQVVQKLKQRRPELTPNTLAIVEREVTAVMRETMDGPNGMLERLVPLYGRTFTHQEIREMVAFYESPVGRKATAALPGLMREGMKIGEDLARESGPELKRRLTEALSKEGVVLDRLPD